MSHTKMFRCPSSSSLQNLLLDDDDDNNDVINNRIDDDDDDYNDDIVDVDDDDLKDLADSCCSDSDVFDPPAWRPGRFLQFADIDLSAEDEPSVRPVSLPTGHLGPQGRCGRGSGCAASVAAGRGTVGLESGGVDSGPFSESFVVQMDSQQLACIRHWRSSLSRRNLVLVTSCMTVALTALTLLSFVLY